MQVHCCDVSVDQVSADVGARPWHGDIGQDTGVSVDQVSADVGARHTSNFWLALRF